MAETFTLNVLANVRIRVVREGVDDAQLLVEYQVTDATGQFQRTRGRLVGGDLPGLTAAQQTQLNGLWDLVVNKIKTHEGLP